MTTTAAPSKPRGGAAKKTGASAPAKATSEQKADDKPADDKPEKSGDTLPESGTVEVMIDGPKTLDELKQSPLASDPVTADVKDSDAALAGLVHQSSLERNTTELDNRITRIVGHDEIRVGAFGDHVTFLQAGLKVLGYHVQVDGNYGAQTQAAVERFRGEHGTKSDSTTVSIRELQDIAKRVLGG